MCTCVVHLELAAGELTVPAATFDQIDSCDRQSTLLSKMWQLEALSTATLIQSGRQALTTATIAHMVLGPRFPVVNPARHSDSKECPL